MTPEVGGDLLARIHSRGAHGLQPVVDFLNSHVVPAAITRYNSEFSPRYFGRPPTELVPTEKRLLTTFRTRLGALIEYGVAVVIDEMFRDDYGDSLRQSFAVAHEYPDFFVRDEAAEVLLRIDAKALHDESAEYSARFELSVNRIDELSDLLLYLAWQWHEIMPAGHEIVYPHVIEGLIVPAMDIATERDRHLELRGGWLDNDSKPRVPPSGDIDTNYGKINRIIHETRRTAHDLSPNVEGFLAFTKRHADAVARAAAGVSESQPTLDELEPLLEDTAP